MIKKREDKKCAGFTLTETLVVIVVFSGVMSISMGIFLGSIRNQRFALYNQRLVTESNYALKRIEEKIRDGEELTTNSLKEYIGDDFTSSPVSVLGNPQIETSLNGERVTVFVETEMKVDEENKISLKLQTTVKKR
jgi:prepilin-type N-terminal cleavage/methylation domain-containing protein